jgi:hypothetical protein
MYCTGRLVSPRSNAAYNSGVGLAASLPLARVAFAMEAGDHVYGRPYNAKEQRVRKTPAPSATHISMDHRKVLGRLGDPFDDVVDFCNEAIGQRRIPGGVPVARFDQLSPGRGAEDD